MVSLRAWVALLPGKRVGRRGPGRRGSARKTLPWQLAGGEITGSDLLTLAVAVAVVAAVLLWG